jgi:hypothetical protein
MIIHCRRSTRVNQRNVRDGYGLRELGVVDLFYGFTSQIAFWVEFLVYAYVRRFDRRIDGSKAVGKRPRIDWVVMRQTYIEQERESPRRRDDADIAYMDAFASIG